MSDGPDGPKRRFGRYMGGVALVSMLAFVILNYRDPWPPIVSPSLAPALEVPTPPAAGSLSLEPPPAIDPDQPAPPEQAAEVDHAVPTTSLPLRLLATAVQEDPSRSFARIEDDEASRAQMLSRGQVFEGRPQVVLVTIESGSVLLDNQGRLERLPLEPGGLQVTAGSLRSPPK